MKITLVLLTITFSLASFPVISGELGALAKKEPIIVHGSAGASFSFSTSNEPFNTRPPFEWNLYGNYTMQILGTDLPFSFKINRYSQNYTHPFTQFGITPAYKWVKVHLGISNIRLSQLSSAGQRFKGIGVELTPDKLHFSAFYGKVSNARNDDTVSGLYERQEYSGIGYGAKLGFGNADNYLDLSYFHAHNPSSSSGNSCMLSAYEVTGIDFKVKISNHLSITGSAAVSGSARAEQGPGNGQSPAGKPPSKYKGIFSTYQSGNIPAWALESAFSLDLERFRAVISYRKVQDGFKDPGDLYSFESGERISMENRISLAKGLININTDFTRQSNDQNTELAGVLNIVAGKNNRTITGNINIRRLYERHPMTGPVNRNRNISASISYDWVVTEKPSRFSLTASYNQVDQPDLSTSSFGATLSAGTPLLQNKKLNLNGTLGYVYNNTPVDSKGNITLTVNASYLAENNRSFSFFVNYMGIPSDTRYRNTDYAAYKTTTHSLSVGITYTIGF
jgi:hypothetical protein